MIDKLVEITKTDITNGNELEGAELEEMKDYLYVQLSNKLMYHRLYVDNQAASMKQQLQRKIQDHQHKIEHLKLILEENNPLKILESGYVVVSDSDGKIMRSAADLQTDSRYLMQFKDGFAKVFVEEIGSENHGKDQV